MVRFKQIGMNSFYLSHMVSSPRFNRYFAYFALALAVFSFIAAAYFFSESGNEKRFILFGLGLVFGGIGMAWGAFQTLKEADVKQGIEERVNQEVLKQVSSENLESFDLGNQEAQVLANWHFNELKWRGYTTLLNKKNRRMEFVVSIGIFLLFVLAVVLGMELGMLVAGAFIAILYYVIRTRMGRKSLALNGNEAHVLITDQFVRINGRFIHFKNGIHFLKEVKIIESPLAHLLLVIAWPTGKGFDNSMDLRIPVPEDELEKLPQLVRQLNLAMNSSTNQTMIKP